MRDHVHALAIDAQLIRQAPAAVLGVHDDGIEVLVQASLRRALAGTRLARKDVVRGQYQRTPVRQQAPIQVLDGEPLEVHHVGSARGAAVAQHVGDVLGELDHATGAGVGHVRGEAIEQLAPRVALRHGDGAVGEAARVQLDLRAGGGQRAAQGVVVGRRVGRGVDDVDAHRLEVLEQVAPLTLRQDHAPPRVVPVQILGHERRLRPEGLG